MVELDVVWSVLGSLFETKEHQSCSTHIHISIEDGWSLQNLKQLAKGWIYFEGEIMAAMPKSRRECEWARPNCSQEYEPRYDAANEMVRLYQEALDQTSFSPLFKYIDDSKSIDELIARVAPERCLSWNLQNMRNKCKTVEFRRPPQSRDAGDCKHWLAFSLSIVQWALAADFDNESTLENPRDFEGTLQQVAENLGIMDSLREFDDLKEDAEQPMSLHESLRTMKKKMEKGSLGETL
ncbi:hypothetical protein MMC22_002582 [Lobaria immixta]|nr:hypothetical protein [Lobaria immixta]